MRGLTRSVIALIVPPLPAPSRPSKRKRQGSTTEQCSLFVIFMGYSAKTAAVIGAQNLRKLKVAEKIEKAQNKRAERTGFAGLTRDQTASNSTTSAPPWVKVEVDIADVQARSRT
jgi:hypothetical protein